MFSVGKFDGEKILKAFYALQKCYCRKNNILATSCREKLSAAPKKSPPPPPFKLNGYSPKRKTSRPQDKNHDVSIREKFRISIRRSLLILDHYHRSYIQENERYIPKYETSIKNQSQLDILESK